MAARLKNASPENVVHPKYMRAGQIGVITHWTSQAYIGRLVMRGIGNMLFSLSNGDYWDTLNLMGDGNYVRILGRGEIIELENEFGS